MHRVVEVVPLWSPRYDGLCIVVEIPRLIECLV